MIAETFTDQNYGRRIPAILVEPAIERVPVLPPDGGAAWRSLYEGPTPPAEPVEDDELGQRAERL